MKELMEAVQPNDVESKFKNTDNKPSRFSSQSTGHAVSIARYAGPSATQVVQVII